MKISLNYGNNVRTLPGKLSDKLLLKANYNQLITLIHITNLENVDINKDSALLNLSVDEFVCALNFWKENKILTFDTSDNSLSKNNTETKVLNERKTLMQESELPSYSNEEISNLMKKNSDLKSLIECCQQIVGKVFTPSEINIVVGMTDYLALKPDFLILLFDSSVKEGHKSLRYIEKVAIDYVDRGINDYNQLETIIENKRKINDVQMSILAMFGIENRKPIEKETNCFYKWICEWKYSVEIIKMAFDLTILNTGKYSLNYLDKVLDNWHSHGLVTVDDIQAYIDNNPNKNKKKESSFDTNDFFTSAVKKTYNK